MRPRPQSLNIPTLLIGLFEARGSWQIQIPISLMYLVTRTYNGDGQFAMRAGWSIIQCAWAAIIMNQQKDEANVYWQRCACTLALRLGLCMFFVTVNLQS